MGVERGGFDLPPREEYRGEINLWDIEVDGKVYATIPVPFSQNELMVLKTILKAKRSLLSEAMRGSGPERDMYTDFDVPFTTELEDREASLQKLQTIKRKLTWLKNNYSEEAFSQQGLMVYGTMVAGMEWFFPEEEKTFNESLRTRWQSWLENLVPRRWRGRF